MDPQKEMKQFWDQMVHTLPAVLQERAVARQADVPPDSAAATGARVDAGNTQNM